MKIANLKPNAKKSEKFFGGIPMENAKDQIKETQNLLKEGKELEERLLQIKKRLKCLANLTNLTIDLDKWEVK